jgi:tRNA (guanosine-2'-O-)-methyltransferase
VTRHADRANRTDPSGRQPPGRRQLRSTDLKRLHRTWRRSTRARVGLLLESVTQPFNVGSIVRTAAVFGVEYLWLTGNATLPTHPGARKVALGTDRLVHWEHAGAAAEGVRAARRAGLRVVALELTADATPLHEAPLAGDVCLAVGGEDHGCSPALLAEVDAVAYIPQVGRVGSLNVAVATAIALAEARRREWGAGDTGDAPAGPAR